jgi:hypothetical protein
MTTALFLWHLALAGLSVVLHQLSVRLGRALADNDRYLPCYFAGAGFLLLGGILWLFLDLWSGVRFWAFLVDLIGAGCSSIAAWSYWSWLPEEIRKAREE